MARILSDGYLDPNADQDCLRPRKPSVTTVGEASIDELRKRIDAANAWRRGGSGPMPDPKILGIDLDTISGILEILNDSGRNSVEKVSACRILSIENDEKRKEMK